MPMPPLRMQPAFTALTCTFSHASLLHLAFNMIAFTSFGGNMSQVLLSSEDGHDLSGRLRNCSAGTGILGHTL